MEQIIKLFPNLTEVQIEQLDALLPLYTEWNSKINVISRKDIDKLFSNHVLHSLMIAKYFNFKADTKILDAGTGGGFPGLPLAIMFPTCDFTLADSIGKKLKVINAISKEIGLNNIKTIHSRVEDIDGEYDFITSRAVTRLDEMWNWVEHLISQKNKNVKPNGLLYLKGGDISLEIPTGLKIERFGLSSIVNNDFYSEKSLIYLHN